MTLKADWINGDQYTAAAANDVATQVNTNTSTIATILNYGVVTGTAASQTTAIKAALDGNPGVAFYFPPGDYRLDTSLAVSENNSLILGPGARIYAAVAMDVLVDYDNGETNPDNYSQDRTISGCGILDGALLADTVLRISSVLRFTVEGLTFRDGINHGVFCDTYGCSLLVRNCHVLNTTTNNVVDNLGVETQMSDCRFENLTMRDVTVGVKDNGGSNYWVDIHAWLGSTTQLTARYENSIGFYLDDCNSVLIGVYADTYRYGFYTGGTYVRARIAAPQIYANPGNLTNELAAAYPGRCFDFAATTSKVTIVDGLLEGHPTTHHAFTWGDTDHFTCRDVETTYVDGFYNYFRGVGLGSATFSPTIYGADVAGTQSYTIQEGLMNVRDGVVSYQFKVAATIGDTADGNLRIGGFPLPVGAASNGAGQGTINYSTGVTLDRVVGGDGSSGPVAVIPFAWPGFTQIDASTIATTAVEVWGQIDCPFTYPT